MARPPRTGTMNCKAVVFKYYAAAVSLLLLQVIAEETASVFTHGAASAFQAQARTR